MAGRGSYLGRVDSALLEGAVAGVLRAHVAVLAPVAGEVPGDAGQAPAGGDKEKERESEAPGESDALLRAKNWATGGAVVPIAEGF